MSEVFVCVFFALEYDPITTTSVFEAESEA